MLKGAGHCTISSLDVQKKENFLGGPGERLSQISLGVKQYK